MSESGTPRIEARFAALAEAGRGGLVTFITAGDPDHDTSLAILQGLAEAGADLIELGMPFSDPMADGPAIQAANLRALGTGASLGRTLDLVAAFRAGDEATPLILMGYFNPIYRYGSETFIDDARHAGADGLIVVDLPPEEDEELREPARRAGLSVIRLATPTTDAARLPAVLAGASGFLYYVAITGITGTRSATDEAIRAAVARLRPHTELPLAVGFGIKTAEQAGAVARVADAAVVGSAFATTIAAAVEAGTAGRGAVVEAALGLARGLAAGVRGAGRAETAA